LPGEKDCGRKDLINKRIQGLDILELDNFTLLGNLDRMTNREQLIQELEHAPDDLVQTVLDFLHRIKAIHQAHPLAKFAGILSDSEAEELQRVIATDCRQVDDEW
jgi:hypothetical protein